MKSKVYRDHDRALRRERRAGKIMHWFVQHGWISGWGLAGYGLAVEGYTDYPNRTDDEFSIMRTGINEEENLDNGGEDQPDVGSPRRASPGSSRHEGGTLGE